MVRTELHRPLSALVAALLVGTSGCASLQKSPEDALRERVTEYYALLVEGNYRKAYEYLTPAYRESMPVENHYQRVPPAGRVKAAKVDSVECPSEDACKVVVALTMEMGKGAGPIAGWVLPTGYEERWVKIGRQWWLLPPR